MHIARLRLASAREDWNQTTPTGTLLPVFVLAPSWPLPFQPQHFASPPVMAQLC